MALSTIDILGGGDGKPPTSIPVTAAVNMVGVTPANLMGVATSSTTSASTQTALTLSGVSGVVEYCSLHNTSGVTLTATLLKITIDGTVVYNETGTLLTATVKNAIGSFGANTNQSAYSLVKKVFNKSLLIEFASDGTNLGVCNFRHDLT